MSVVGRLMFCTLVAQTAASALAQSERHVIQISVDGLHAQGLQRLMRTRPDDLSNFRRLFDEGSSTLNARSDFFSTLTLPNHTSMLTGRPVQQPADDATAHHGYVSNSTPAPTTMLHSFNPNVEYIASTFDTAHDRGLSTALYASKRKFVLFEQTYTKTEQTDGGRPDQFPEDGDHGSDKIDQIVLIEENLMSTAVVEQFVTDMTAEAYDYAFLHLTEPDLIGHTEGWRTTAWDDSVAIVDQHLGRVLKLIEDDEQLSQSTTVLLTSDHGGAGFFHTSNSDPNHYTVPFLAWGAAVAPGTDLYNLNLGTRVDPLDRRPAFTDNVQPIRNADAANLAMSLLGLPIVEDSRINTRQDLLVDVWGSAIWDPAAGSTGDGVSWTDAQNWMRNGQQDTRPLAADFVEFAVNSETQSIDVGGFQRVQSLTFHGDYQLQNADLDLLSGRIQLDPGTYVSFEGNVRSQNTLVVEGDATLEVNGTADTILLSQGLLIGDVTIQGQIFSSDRISPGSEIGTIRVDEHFTQLSSGTLIMEIESGDPLDPRHDQLLINLDLNVRGRLAIEPTAEYQDPAAGGEFDRFQLITMNRRVASRTFAAVDYAGETLELIVREPELQRHHAGAGLFRSLHYSDKEVAFVNYRAFAGDANGDGSFDSNDIVDVFAAGLYEDGDNDNATWMTGDWNGDLDFGSDDLVAAFSSGRFNQRSVFDELPAVANVPEPSMLTLVALGVISAALLRRIASGGVRRTGSMDRR